MARPRLPIDEIIPRIQSSLAEHNNLVILAPPGAGKTTRVAPALLGAYSGEEGGKAWEKGEAPDWLGENKIIMLEPRRLATRGAAARIALELGEKVGETAGYRIRFENKVSRKTRIEVVTEGILTRRLQTDPELTGVGVLIFDEFHERSLQTDLGLALALDIQSALREDLRIIIMSATLDPGPVAKLLNQAPVLESQGRAYPVQIDYQGADDLDKRGILQNCEKAIIHSLEADKGDLLVFLPGAGEIRGLARRLEESRGKVRADFQICPLYGELKMEEQDRAIRPDPRGRRKVVLATPIAETSLTIEGISVVIDSGFCRLPVFDPGSGFTRLETRVITKDSAAQRAGRAGRLGPGKTYRLWSEWTQSRLEERRRPEIQGADLADLVLNLAEWGAEAATLRWLDPPPPPHLENARRLLIALEAIDEQGAITAAGKQMNRLPLHPRLAHVLVRAASFTNLALACDLAALLSEKDILRRDPNSFEPPAWSLDERLELLEEFRLSGHGPGADQRALSRVEQVARQIFNLARDKQNQSNDSTRSRGAAPSSGVLLGFAYPDRIAGRRPGSKNRYHLSSGKGAALPDPRKDAALSEGEDYPEFLVAAHLSGDKRESKIYLGARLTRAEIQEFFQARLSVTETVAWDPREKIVRAERRLSLGKLSVESTPLEEVDPALLQVGMLTGIRQMGLSCLPWGDETKELLLRIQFLRNQNPDSSATPFPDFSDETLFTELETWLTPFLGGARRANDLTNIDLKSALTSRMDYALLKELDELAPTHITVPSGSNIRLQYEANQVILSVKLQELFGLSVTPSVNGGRTPLTLHLLSPARRPIQITKDLAGFWKNTYPEVKKELMGRYPKHPWPEDPLTAPPSAKTKRSSARRRR